MDSQWHFTNAVAIQKSLDVAGLLPKMIIIGIQTSNPLRRALMYGQRDKFLDFIEKDIISYVDKTLKTSGERILFGWEAAAFFSNYALLNERGLFNAAIITNGADTNKATIEKFKQLNGGKNKYFIHC